MEEEKNGGWVEYSEKIFNTDDFPGIELFLKQYTEIEKVRKESNMSQRSFEAFMSEKINEDKMTIPRNIVLYRRISDNSYPVR